MAVGQHETITIGPLRLRWMMAQMAAPQGHSHVRHAHWGTGVTGVGLLDGIHSQRANGVRHGGDVLGGVGHGGRGCCGETLILARWEAIDCPLGHRSRSRFKADPIATVKPALDLMPNTHFSPYNRHKTARLLLSRHDRRVTVQEPYVTR